MLQSRQQSIQRETRDAWSEWSKSDWAYFPAMNDDPNESIIDLEIKKRDWMKNRSVIELTSQFFTDVSIETNIHIKTNKGWNETSKWSNLLFVGHQCFNECINRSIEKQKSELNIEGWWSLLLRAERWSNPIETTIVLEGNKGLSDTLKGDRAYPSAMTDQSNSMETTINLERETRTWIKVP